MLRTSPLSKSYSDPPTREFTHQSYQDEIDANINGFPIFPPQNADQPAGSLRLVNIHVSAEGLSNRKLFSKADPLCALYVAGSHGLHEYGRTEVCWNIANPLWVRPFTYHVRPGPSLLIFSIYDIISTSASLSEQRGLGECQIDLIDLLAAPDHSVDLDIENGSGVLHVRFYDMEPCQGSLFFRFFLRLPSQIRRPNPFFIVERLSAHGQAFIPVYKSRVISQTCQADWENIELSVQFTCGGDFTRLVRLRVFDCRRSNTENCLGFVDTSVDVIMSSPQSFKLCDASGKHTGEFLVTLLNHWTTPRLFDFRLRGVQLAAMLAIDFSSTPLDQIYSNRVQHLNTGAFSYRTAINDTCDLLNPLTMGQPYVAYGFANFPGELKLSPLDDARDFIPSAKRLIQLYDLAKQRTMYPSKARIAPVFRKAREVAQRRWAEERTITILVVLTNGRFSDLQEGIDELVEGQDDPLCVIMIVMGGRRRDLDRAFRKKHGRIQNRNGTKTKRRVLSMGSYLEDQVYPDERLPQKLAPSAKKIARQWLELMQFDAAPLGFGASAEANPWEEPCFLKTRSTSLV
jgi:hypothetical protein